jgi:uncharacterized membrane protein
VVSGVGLALSRFVWTTDVWLLPYALFWIWVVAVCIRLLRGVPSAAIVESARGDRS